MVDDVRRTVRVLAPLALWAGLAACSEGTPPAQAPAAASSLLRLTPSFETAPVAHDADDPAVWVAPGDPARSLILGTDKEEKVGGLFVFGLDGAVRQVIAPLDRPNNVDVEYGFVMGDERRDIAVLTERMQRRLRVFAIPPDGGMLVDLAPDGLPVLEGQQGEAGEPMGIALYKRPADEAMFAIVSPKTGGPDGYLWQYRLDWDGTRVRGTIVRQFGRFSRIGAEPGEIGEIEAIVVDDVLDHVFYSDERFGIRKWRADPDATDADIELAVFGTEGYQGDREGLAIYETADGRGLLVASDQIDGGTRLHVYRREGEAANPHSHPTLAVLETQADGTDGLEVTSRALPGFPRGLLVMMNSRPRTFQVYDWGTRGGAVAEQMHRHRTWRPPSGFAEAGLHVLQRFELALTARATPRPDRYALPAERAGSWR